MKSRGISGFSVIVILIIVLIIGYVAYQIGRLYFTYGAVSEKVEHAAETSYAMNDYEIVQQLMKQAQEAKVELNPDSIFIDRTIPDSLRIYVAYEDSSNIFNIYTYRRHFVIDKVAQIKIRF